MDQSTSMPRKRNRRTLACTLCHRRKVKCDQSMPECTRCVRSGSKCTYFDSKNPDTNNTNGWHKKEFHAVHQGSKVVRDFTSPTRTDTFVSAGVPPLENKISNSDPEEDGKVPETMLFKGLEFATQNFGATSPVSPLIHFPALRAFIADASKTAYAAVPNLAKDFKILQNSIRNNSTSHVASAESSLVAMLPEHDVCKAMAELYLERFDIIYRVLHGPIFWRSFDSIWRSISKPNVGSVAILLLVILIADTILPAQYLQARGLASPILEPAPTIVETCEAWLSTQTRKYLTMEHFQIRVLLHMAKQVHCIQLKQSWTCAGTLIRFFMAAGLHREPSLLGDKISPYGQEMRRTLWATASELELQASLDRGMVTSISSQMWDCKAPNVIKQDEHNDDSHGQSESSTCHGFPENSFNYYSRQSIRLRAELCLILNDTSANPSFTDILDREDQISSQLENLPKSKTEKGTVIRTVLVIQLHQYLLLIHFRHLQQLPSGAKRRYSAITCANTAAEILRGYAKLQELGYSGYSFMTVGGILRAALAFCQTLSMSPDLSIVQPFNKNHPSAATDLLSIPLTILKEHSLRHGRGMKEFWYVSAAHGFLQIQKASNERERDECEREAWERVVSLCYRCLAARGLSRADYSQTPSQDLPATTDFDEAGFVPEIASRNDWLSIPGYSQWSFDDVWGITGGDSMWDGL